MAGWREGKVKSEREEEGGREGGFSNVVASVRLPECVHVIYFCVGWKVPGYSWR